MAWKLEPGPGILLHDGSGSEIIPPTNLLGLGGLAYLAYYKSHQPSGLGWFRVVCLFSTPLLFNPSGFNPLGRGLPLPYPLPRASEPPWLGTSGLLIETFFPSGRSSFFHRFFDAIFDRSWLDFASQLGSQNPPKSMKNRCQDAFPS